MTVASNAERLGSIDFDDLQGARRYSGARAYNQSKLANLLFTYELARRLPANEVTANALHPGLVRTSFGADDPAPFQRLLVPFLRPFMTSPSRGADTSIRLASAPALGAETRTVLPEAGPPQVLRTELRPGDRGTSVAPQHRADGSPRRRRTGGDGMGGHGMGGWTGVGNLDPRPPSTPGQLLHSPG